METNFLDVQITEFYSYRSNRCRHSFIIFDVPRYEIQEYIESQGFKMDNHISWRNEYGLCFTYSDGNLYIGNGMIDKSW